MESSINQNLHSFPTWSPTRATRMRINAGIESKNAFYYYRNSCSGFTAKKVVRDIIFEKCGSKCTHCGAVDNLQIDHIVSVYACFKSGLLNTCNTYENLQVLCGSCNASKKP